MIILLIIISIIGLIIACVIDEDFAGFFLVCFCVLFVIGIFLGISVSNGKTIDEKIAMYQEENSKIEKQIDTLVSNYMNYESDTYEKIKSESSITLVSMYPELKSDKLVEEQISVYEENNKKIREFKEDKINLKVKKWWLYFGGR
ncbi:MAG: hypothetical protein KHZ96_07550 [Coprobacillus sp.]|nr:hypothetical protein [Coprobacillus sp.]